jgi:hypothetical protein
MFKNANGLVETAENANLNYPKYIFVLKLIIFVNPQKEAVKCQIFWRMEETARVYQ